MIRLCIFYISGEKTAPHLVSQSLEGEFVEKIKSFSAELNFTNVLDKNIINAQKSNLSQKAQSASTAAFERALGIKGEEKTNKSLKSANIKLANAYNIALSPSAKELDSMAFAELLQNKAQINFFIGGAFGLESEFVKRCDFAISLSRLTFSHQIARLVLCEQIYRAFSILNAHPYHKI